MSTTTCALQDPPSTQPADGDDGPDPTTAMTDLPTDHPMSTARDTPTPSPVSPALRELADATVAAAIARPFTPWSRGRAAGGVDIDPGVEFGRILSWLHRQPGPAGHDAAAYLVQSYVRSYRHLHPTLEPATILLGIDGSVREASPDLHRINELHGHRPPAASPEPTPG